MNWKPLSTVTKEDDDKGRTFTVRFLFAICTEDRFGSASEPHRPTLLAYCGTATTSRSFTANLKLGRAATWEQEHFEILRSGGQRYLQSSPVPDEVLTVVYDPVLFHLAEAGTDTSRISFVVATPQFWIERQIPTLAHDFEEAEAREVALAADFVARLNSRSALPIVNDLRFHLALYRAARDEDWLHTETGTRLRAFGNPADLGLTEPTYCDVDLPTFRTFLAEVTADYMARRSAPPVSPSAVSQLTLGFAA